MLIIEKIKDLFNKEKRELDIFISNSFFDIEILNKVNNILTSSKTIYQKKYCYNIIKEYSKCNELTEETLKILEAYLLVLNFEIKYYYFTLEQLGDNNE